MPEVEKTKAENVQQKKEEKIQTNKQEKNEQEDEIIDNYDFDAIKDQKPEKIEEKETSSPLLDKSTKEKLINLGQSLDSKQLADALGYIDLRLLLKCFSKAVMKHINYSRGYLFLEDLKMAQSQQDELNFTYGLQQNMKININKREKEEIDELSASK